MTETPRQAPTAGQLLAQPAVTRALDEAWSDSDVDDPQRRHEEGGWIFLETNSSEITIRRAVPGGQAAIDLSNPPVGPRGSPRGADRWVGLSRLI